MRDEAVASLRALNEVVERLRAPGGCPWDAEQTHRSLRPYLLEETYELLEALEGGDPATLCEELGDVLLQVLMHSAIAAEDGGAFDIGDVADTTRTKMVHRHPHVFGDTASEGADAVVINWERLKRAEKTDRLSLLDGIPRAMPALAYAFGVQKRPARIGFDQTPTTASALETLRCSIDAIADRAAGSPDAPRGRDWALTDGDPPQPGTQDRPRGTSAAPDRRPAAPASSNDLERDVGDLLFAAVALARRLRVNPEDALRVRSDAQAETFRQIEKQARDEGLDVHDIDGDEWARRWAAASRGARPLHP